ncbi:MAG: transposase zinc-binding domain-containing protein, partial [Candidatus Eisenbacteria sp.]|nr:transposase zinc-binding domain-containing protein [Candidatus Eisenbacteria bacterium]
MAQIPGRPRFEVADIVRLHGDPYRRARPPTPAQEAVLRHIADCRTAALGGHVDACSDCGHQRISYNSCRDRHCPKCQSLARADWLEARLKRLLPVPYFHLVFTIPDDLNPLALGNRRLFFNLLFATAADTLKTLARDEKHLGAEVGFTAVLHTWGQNLRFHPHLHCVVTGGGLSPNGQRWVRARPRFFLPVKVLGRLFRGKLLDALKRARATGTLHFGGSTERWSPFFGQVGGIAKRWSPFFG